MIAPKVISRSYRKSLAITIDEKGDLIVKAPYLMSLEEIFSFLEKKQKWIEDRQYKIKNTLEKNFELINYKKVLFLGKKYTVCFARGVKSPFLTNDAFILEMTTSLKSIKKQIQQFLINSCDKILLPRICTIAEKMRVDYSSIKVISSKAKWGMCDNNHNLYFNFKLLMLSPELIDYVIIHELCHIKHLNHSEKFWRLVGKTLPKYKQLKKLLKDTGFIIKLF